MQNATADTRKMSSLLQGGLQCASQHLQHISACSLCTSYFTDLCTLVLHECRGSDRLPKNLELTMSRTFSVDPNSQKTHYSIDLASRKRQRTDQDREVSKTELGDTSTTGPSESAAEKQLAQSHCTPLLALPNETAAHVKHRYASYERIWAHQMETIEAILDSANHALFGSLLRYIHDPLSTKLDTAFLCLSSNTANNLRLLDEFSLFVLEEQQKSAHLRMVRLSSKTCSNVKAAVCAMITQIVEGGPSGSHTDDIAVAEDDNSEKEGSEDEDEADEDVEGNTAFAGGRISYDFENVQDWMDAYTKIHKCADTLRIVVVLDDSDGFANEVLNQLLLLICIYSRRYPIKVIMALSSRSVGDWISTNVTSKLRTLIQSVKLEAKDNREIAFQAIDEVLLLNETTADNPLLLDAHLSLIVLNRFENANNSIDSLFTELKLAYMIHFYRLPLSALVDAHFVPEKVHYDALRKLPSFKTYIEIQLCEYEKNPAGNDGARTTRLFLNNKELKILLDGARSKMQTYQNAVMNAVHMVNWLCGGSMEKFHIYKLITNNQFATSTFAHGIVKGLDAYSGDEFGEYVSFLSGPDIKNSVGTQTDDAIVELKKRLEVSRAPDLRLLVADYFRSNKHLNMKISDNLFHEVFTLNGGRSELDDLKPAPSIEENYENLMLKLIRPRARDLIETALDEPQKYLRNPLILETMGQKRKRPRLVGPPLCQLYRVYKDAPVSINLWDFYVAFKQSLLKPQVLAEIERHVPTTPESSRDKLALMVGSAKENEGAWEKMVYGWFLQGCYELSSLGFLKEKVKGDYMEKLIWRSL